jgi:hypothetical protein
MRSADAGPAINRSRPTLEVIVCAIGRVLRIAFLTCSATLLASVGTAWADPPANDTFSGASVISSVPYNTTEDTTQATLDSADTAAGQACSASGVFSNSVWFAYTPTSDQELQLNTSASGYSVAGAVLTGSPASFSAVSCFLGSTSFQVTHGTTYYIDVLQYGVGTGGTLNMSITPLVPPNPVLTVNSAGQFDTVSGAASVSGTASCAAGAFAFVFGTVSTQPHGRNAAITGSGSPISMIVCDGSPHPWSFVATPSSGLFKGGPVTADVSMFACSGFCQSQQITQTVNLKH